MAPWILSWAGPPEWAWRRRRRTVAGARHLLPEAELAHARLRIAEDDPVRGQALHGERRVRGHVLELGEPVLPVVPVGGHHLRPVHRLRLGARRGDPRVAHQHDLGGPPRLPRGLAVGVDQAAGVLELVLGVPTKPSAMRPARRAAAGRCRRTRAAAPAAGSAGADLHVFQRVVGAPEGEGSPAQQRRRISTPSSNSPTRCSIDTPKARKSAADSRCPRPGRGGPSTRGRA